MKHPKRFTTLPPWLIALVVVLGGTDWAYGLLARQTAADNAALETIQIRSNVYVIFWRGE